NFIDIYIPSTKVMIEQKSIDKDLREPIRQSDGTLLNPFQQARKYISGLPLSQHPRWVVTSNFKSFLVYDMENPNGEPEEILLENLEKEYYRLSFITDQGSVHLKKELEVSKKAGDIIGEIYDAILKQYKDADNPSPATLKSLNMLCVRIVFCLYAEDAGIFGHKSIFGDYLKQFEAKDLRRALLDLFQILDQKEEERDEYLEESLAVFPYVNGGLFTEEDKTIPPLTEEIKELLVKHASNEFDWSEISPTIFGAIFESTLNPETRRSGGMHYTSIENIHKVIDPLFLDDLKAEFEELKQIKNAANRIEKVKEFHKRLGTLKFLDPACGSGNFLTETYLSLRKLGNECIKAELNIGEGELALTYKAEDLIQVSIQQFYGIEINDFAAVVAKTALWIAESQMMKETAKIIEKDLKFLPLHTYANIIEGNALRIDWAKVGEVSPSLPSQVAPRTVPASSDDSLRFVDLSATPSSGDTPQRPVFDYILGNPPFVGAQYMTKEQKNDLMSLFPNNKHSGELDFVAGWYKKAADFIKNTNTHCAFVSTNSITQGEQVSALWKDLFADGLKFDFAYRTFRWDSEANIKAHVHCVIIGFSCKKECHTDSQAAKAAISITSMQNEAKPHSELLTQFQKESKKDFPLGKSNPCGNKKIFLNESQFIEAKNINGYLLDADSIFIESRSKPLCNVPLISKGCQPTDGGNLIIEEKDYDEFIKKEPNAKKFIKNLVGAHEFINNKKRYCLWLVGANPSELKKMPLVMKRIEACRQMRLASSDKATQRLAETPTLFREQYNPKTYIIVPSTSSERRRYIPLGFLDDSTISTNLNLIIPDATLYHFGILTSNVHMAWMRAVAGRLEMSYRYSKDIVYNNFPWPQQFKIDNSKLRMENGKWTLSGEDLPADKKELSIFHSQLSIINTAQAILDARAKYPDSSLADLYDETLMPPELRKAHQANDRAVMAAYGFSTKMTESECVAELFKMYEKLTEKI
ncbi:MAG: hypothetical protein MST09_02590, partial [Spirochaetia bacterium]|nr:hypothetical protein [Spirochaetia bacterium]